MLDRAKGPVGLMRGGQEFIPFVYDHFVTTLSKNNIFSISVREGVLGLFLSLRALREGTSGGPCRELILSLRNAACALLLLFVMAEAEAVAEAEAASLSAGDWASRTRTEGSLARLELISIFTLKTTINN